jgi:Glycosyl transferases group 1
MRILLSCLQSLKLHPVPAYDFWRTYFVQGLQEAGHEIVEVPGIDWVEGIVHPAGVTLDAWRERTWETVHAFLRKESAHKPVQLFLSYLYPEQVEPAAIQELQRMGIPCVNFFCDNVREFRTVPPEYRPFALHWVPEFEALPMYRKANLPHLHAPMPCWVRTELRSLPTNETEPATFIGSADVLRRDLVGHAMRAGADFIVRGRGWAERTNQSMDAMTKSYSISKTLLNQLTVVHRHGIGSLLKKVGDRLRPIHPPPIPASNIRDPVGQAEYFRITRDAIVTIGINRVPTARSSNRHPLVYSRLRDIEAPMLGACYLTEWTEGLEALYELGSEIETYRSASELSEKLGELEKNSQRRRAVRDLGQRRALTDHTVSRSVARIGARLGLSARS